MDEQNLFAEHLLQFWESMCFDFGILSSNPNITFDVVEKYINNPWDWYKLSSSPNLTFDVVEKYINKPWDWYELSSSRLYLIILPVTGRRSLSKKFGCIKTCRHSLWIG